MKKVLFSMLMSIMSAALLTGCTSDTETVIGDSVLSETTEEISEETPVVSEEVATSEETSIEEAEEVVMYSADEVMAHIDSLITQYQYNDPEHIKALVIAANLDYISEEDLNTILSTYGYTMEELAVKYDECILDNGEAHQQTFDFRQGNIDTLTDENTYKYRITLNAVMMNETDAENARWYDGILYQSAHSGTSREDIAKFREYILNINGNELNVAARVCYSYTWGVFYNQLTYIDYLDNPFVVHNK